VHLIVATGNRGKAAEFEALLQKSGITIQSLADYPATPEILEDGDTFVENALIKARAVRDFTGFCALADDSGLEVDALGGLPGIRSARFGPTTAERNARLLDMMKEIPDDRRSARFVCALALVRPDGFEWTTIGTCEGMIPRSPSGAEGFGYDPLFFYPPLGHTFAEIPLAEKNRISHRGRALEALLEGVDRGNILGGCPGIR
jgi:XTP/dITP diphosphohydrolase